MLLLMQQPPNDVLRRAVGSVQDARDWVAGRPDMTPFHTAIEVAREIHQFVREGKELAEEYERYETAAKKLNERYRRFATPVLPRGLGGNADIQDWRRRIDRDADRDRAWTWRCLLTSLLFDQLEDPRTPMQLALILVEAATHVGRLGRPSRAELVVLAVAQGIGQHVPFDALGNKRLDDKADALRKERRQARRTMLDVVARPLMLYSPGGTDEEDLFERRLSGTTYRIKDPHRLDLGVGIHVTTRITHAPPGKRNIDCAPRPSRGKPRKRASAVGA